MGKRRVIPGYVEQPQAQILLTFSADSGAVKPPKSLLHSQFGLEAEVGIEPTHTAFAEPCLTTWLLRPIGREA